MPDRPQPPEPVKAAEVVVRALFDHGAEYGTIDPHEAATDLLAALSERAGGGGFYVDEDGVLWRGAEPTPEQSRLTSARMATLRPEGA